MTQVKLLVTFLILVTFTNMLAHPAMGIQVNSEGEVYYSDLVHIWKIDAKGNNRVYIKNVHAHMLKLSKDQHLYGEHSWFDEADAEFKSSFWLDDKGIRKTLSPGEAVQHMGISFQGQFVYPTSNLHQKRVAFTRYSKDATPDVIYQESMGEIDGNFNEARFGVFGDWYVHPSKGTYILSAGQLRHISKDGRVKTLLGSAEGFDYDDTQFSQLQGIAADEQQLYIADYGNKTVYRLNLDSDSTQTEKVYESGWFWSPSGVSVRGNQLYILEFSTLPGSAKVRVQQLDLTSLKSKVIATNDT